MFTGFPWNPAAAVLVPTPLIAHHPLIGTYALSGLVVLLGGADLARILQASGCRWS